jgi:predicted metalloprotease with PDZ domain
LWHVKRIKPEKFTPYDLRAEVHTGLLWVFEGITSYYDHLTLLRSGLIPASSYLEHLATGITRLARTRGRLHQTLEESSFDAWTHFYRQDPNSSNAIISYYNKGALVALALDLTLRKESAGKCSLDDVMRECWARYGETGQGMPERGLESLAREVSGLELADFFERYVRGTAEIPLERLLQEVGVVLHMRPSSGSADTGGKRSGDAQPSPPWLGANLADRPGQSVFSLVHSGSPAEKAGIAPGDIAVALDDLQLNAANLDERLREHHAGNTVTICVFRDEHLMRFKVRLAAPPEDAYYLEFESEPDERVLAMRNAWLRSGCADAA